MCILYLFLRTTVTFTPTAGQETTSDGITFTLMGIVSNPEVEERSVQVL